MKLMLVRDVVTNQCYPPILAMPIALMNASVSLLISVAFWSSADFITTFVLEIGSNSLTLKCPTYHIWYRAFNSSLRKFTDNSLWKNSRIYQYHVSKVAKCRNLGSFGTMRQINKLQTMWHRRTGFLSK